LTFFKISEGVYLNLKKDIALATKNEKFYLNPGDCLILYTDGLTEAVSAQGEILDLGGTINIMRKHVAKDLASAPKMIFADVIRWCGNHRADDMTIVIIKRKHEINE
jgi:sigma-B regulation protein RsbU (phosphoserine phosphatase)